MENINDKQLMNEYLSNERTFLSWIRTGIGVLVFGFVIVKFSLFLKYFPTKDLKEIPVPISHFTVYVGFGFLITGASLILLAYIRYINTVKLLKKGEYNYSSLLITIISILLFIMIFPLIAYLIVTSY